ncbi:hypothetical protein LINPERPRIM_LOCUS8406, partial [Linum perenne]
MRVRVCCKWFLVVESTDPTLEPETDRHPCPASFVAVFSHNILEGYKPKQDLS